MPALGVGTVGSLEVAGGQVVEHEGVFPQVPYGEPLLDPGLAVEQPIHRRMEFVLIDFAQPERLAEGGDGALGGEGAGGGELGPGVNDAGDDEGEDEVSEAAGAPGDEGVQLELLEGAEDGDDVPVGEAADAGEGVLGRDEAVAAEDAAEGLDGGVGELGEVGEGALPDFPGVTVGLSEEDGGRRVAVGHAVDIHGYPLYQYISKLKHILS